MADLLIAEDDFAVRDFIRRALEMDGHNVTVTHEGSEALQRINADGKDYDLFVSDIRMPVIDGLSLSKLVFRAFPELPILFITGYSGLYEESDVVPSVIGILQKPFTVHQIQDAVQSALAKKQQKPKAKRRSAHF